MIVAAAARTSATDTWAGRDVLAAVSTGVSAETPRPAVRAAASAPCRLGSSAPAGGVYCPGRSRSATSSAANATRAAWLHFAGGLTQGEVAERLLQEAGVAVLPGTAFGAHGEGYLRISYANSEANLRLALERMRPVCARLAGV